MHWNVYYHDFNHKKMIKRDIFEHGWLIEEFKKILKKSADKTEFAELVDRELKYHFWSKCEHEIIISPWVGDAPEMKIDVYDQIRMNWNVFINYVWEGLHEEGLSV